MKKLFTSLVIARWTAAAYVAYLFVHEGSGALTKMAISWHAEGALALESGLLLAFGLTVIVAAIGLFADSVLLRMASAAGLLLATLAPDAGIPVSIATDSCVVLVTMLVLLPRIPALETITASRKFHVALGDNDFSYPSIGG